MRRKLFFFLERAQVTRRERVAFGILGGSLVILGLLHLVVEEKIRADSGYYRELEEIFGERSRQVQQEEERLMARYRPSLPTLPVSAVYSERAAAGTGLAGGHSIRTNHYPSEPDTAATGSAGTADRSSADPSVPSGRRNDLQVADGSGGSGAERTVSEDVSTGTSPDFSAGESVNINTAGVSELQQIPGIGPAFATRIVEWRMAHGPFTSVDQLLAVRGIGRKRLESLRRYVTL